MADSLKGTLFNELLQKVDACKDDYVKAKNGTRTASARVRATMLTIKKLSEAIYKEMNGVKH
jgi:beta-mannanase